MKVADVDGEVEPMFAVKIVQELVGFPLHGRKDRRATHDSG